MTTPRPGGPRVPERPRSPFARFAPPPVDDLAELRRMLGAVKLGYAYPQRFIVGEAAQPATPAKPKRGDKVEVVITGYVDRVEGDDVYLVDKRAPFAGEARPVAQGRFDDPDAQIRVVEPAPAEPKVGDVITGAQLKATPWKRGTQIAHTNVESRYVLTAAGEWRHVESGTLHGFHWFGPAACWRVEHAPGK